MFVASGKNVLWAERVRELEQITEKHPQILRLAGFMDKQARTGKKPANLMS